MNMTRDHRVVNKCSVMRNITEPTNSRMPKANSPNHSHQGVPGRSGGSDMAITLELSPRAATPNAVLSALSIAMRHSLHSKDGVKFVIRHTMKVSEGGPP